MNERFKADIGYAKMVIKDKGELRPMFMMFTEKHGTIPVIPLEFNTDAEKNMFCSFFQLAMVRYQAYAYTYMFEAWMVQRKADGEDPLKKINADNPVSAQKDKIEAVIVCRNTPDVSEMYSCPIHRDEKGEVTFGEGQTMEGVMGRFADLLPPPEIMAKELTPQQKDIADKFMRMFSEEVKL